MYVYYITCQSCTSVFPNLIGFLDLFGACWLMLVAGDRRSDFTTREGSGERRRDPPKNWLNMAEQ